MYAIHFYINISCHIDFLGRVNISNRALRSVFSMLAAVSVNA